MRTHIDWLTFTMTPRFTQDWATLEPSDLYARSIQNAFLDMFGEDLVSDAFGGKWEQCERSRAPYRDAWDMEQAGIRLYASPTLTHCCIEISGQGCERLIAQGVINSVLRACHTRVTRIDIAADIQTDTTPTQFTASLNNGRITASGYQKSESGETCYVGSQKSDRYARVYRYAAPHPRSHLLRIEHVFRKEYAKSVAAACLGDDMESVAAAAGNIFGWAHGDWVVDSDTSADISVVRAERQAGKTVFWLVNSVAPAFKRLCDDGTIKNPEEFLNRYFLGDKSLYA